MSESSIKKGQYITVKSFFFLFLYKNQKDQNISHYLHDCASCLEITEKEHTNILIRKMLHSLHLLTLLLIL